MRSLLLPVVLLPLAGLLAQDGTIDTAFDPMDLSGGTANGLNGSCWAIAMQPDGKILVAGNFTIVNGVERNGVARLHPDGSLDLEFDPGFGANGNVRTLAVQPDGKVLVGGMFTYFNAQYCNHIIRLNADGSVDESFDTGNGFDGNVYVFLARPDGDILVGGDYYHFNGEMARGLVRLNTDGSLDLDFHSGDISGVYSLAPMSDGRVVVGGIYSYLSGVDRRCIGAIENDGSVDYSFAPFGWNSSPVFAVAVQEDGKVLAGGMIPGGLARMEANGEIDPFFGSGVTGFGGWDPWVYAMTLQSDGKIICAGRFASYNGTPCNGIARLNADGTMDEGFHIGSGFNADVFAMARQNDGKVLVGGFFEEVDGTPRAHIARLHAENLTTDIAAIDELTLDIFPNPSTGLVYIATDDQNSNSIRIIGPDGREVNTFTTTGMRTGRRSIDLSGHAKGVYMLRINAGERVRTERLVIE